MNRWVCGIVVVLGGMAMSCASLSGVRSYYVSEGVLQYFVESSELLSRDAKVEMDFTYRADPSNEHDVACNFTVSMQSGQPHSVESAAFLLDGSTRCNLEDLSVLFLDRAKHGVRMSSRMPFQSFSRLLNADTAELEIVADGARYRFKPSATFCSHLNDAKRELIGS